MGVRRHGQGEGHSFPDPLICPPLEKILRAPVIEFLQHISDGLTRRLGRGLLLLTGARESIACETLIAGTLAAWMRLSTRGISTAAAVIIRTRTFACTHA